MKTRPLLFVFFSPLLFTGCAYAPIIADIPLISSKNELRVDGGISTAPAFNVTVSYGLTDKIAVQTFANLGDHNMYYLHGAIGYYKNLGENKIMEIYGGFGYGYGNALSDAYPGFLAGNYQTYFTQFNIGKVNGRIAHLDYGIGLKAGLLHSKMTDKNYYDRYYLLYEPFTTYKDNSLLFEPTCFVRFGGERLKVNFKLGGLLMYKFTNTYLPFPYCPLDFGIGLNYLF